MLSDGKVVYFGSPSDSMAYLRTQNLACPDGYNAADHWIDLLVSDGQEFEKDAADGDERNELADANEKNNTQEVQSLLVASPKMVLPRLQLQQAWDGEAVAEQLDAAIDDIGTTGRSSNTEASLSDPNGRQRNSKYNSSWATQYWVLTHRCLKNSRSAIFTPLNLVKSVCIGIVAGMLWWQMYVTAHVFDSH